MVPGSVREMVPGRVPESVPETVHSWDFGLGLGSDGALEAELAVALGDGSGPPWAFAWEERWV